jgi:hypothetical protein
MRALPKPRRRPAAAAIRRAAAAGLLAAAATLAGPARAQSPDLLAAYETCIEGMVAAGGAAADAIRACQGPAEAGITGAQFALGELLLREGPTRNPVAAFRWYRLAAERGNPAAQFALALMLGNGIGAAADRDAALGYLGKAYCAGYPLALTTIVEQEIDPNPFGCEARQPPPLDGTWSGELAWVHASSPAGRWKTDSLSFRLTIAGDAVTVEALQDGEWGEVKPGKFRLTRLKGNAVVFSLDDGWDFDGNWVEGWTINLAPVDEGTLAATWTRSVANLQTPESFDSRTFTAVAAGTFTREPPAVGAGGGAR